MNRICLRVLGAEYGSKKTDIFNSFYTDAEYDDVAKALQLTLCYAGDHPEKYEGWTKEEEMKYRAKCIKAWLKRQGFIVAKSQDNIKVGADLSFYISGLLKVED